MFDALAIMSLGILFFWLKVELLPTKKTFQFVILNHEKSRGTE